MMHLVQDIIKHFSFDDINVDNWVFKLFYKGSFILFLMGSMVGILSQYFGEPINCDFKGIDSEMASDYCWIHGSSYIPPEYQQHMKCVVDLDGIESSDDAPDTSYYQWVTFVMMVQAGTFMLPYKIWKACEGGLIEEFGMEAKAPIMLNDEYDDSVVMDAVIEKYVRFFRSILHRNSWYFGKYLVCEFLNFVVLFLNFYVTDMFLNGHFWYYGWDVIKYTRLSKAEQKVAIDPFCAAFPLEVSCTVPNIGAAGGEQNHNGLCVLSQNIINEKMYLAVWFWMVFLIMIFPFCIIYRVLTLFFDLFRNAVLATKIGNTNDREARKAISFVLKKLYIGDWFVLYQLSKNTNMYFFRAFIKELRYELKEFPKKKKPAYVENEEETKGDKAGGNNLLGGLGVKPKKGGLKVNVGKKFANDDSDAELGDGHHSSSLSSEEDVKTPVKTIRRQSSKPATTDADDEETDAKERERERHRRRYLPLPRGMIGRHNVAKSIMKKGPGRRGTRGKSVGAGMDDFEMDMMMINM